ncbi:TlpA family protein disulfide reductase [Candidatus Bathyarchaeota archaeon]|nr:TlpA family protein disulfide reductase [Candidatus Bathyarchaeota archaeon]
MPEASFGRGRGRIITALLAVIIIAAGVWSLLRLNRRVAPDFSLTDLEGNTLRLSDFKGEVVVLNFMTASSRECELQIYYYREIWNECKEGVVFLFIEVDPLTSEEALRALARQYPCPNGVWAKDSVNLVQTYEVTDLPETIIIDKEGYIRHIHVGVTPTSSLIQEILSLLNRG